MIPLCPSAACRSLVRTVRVSCDSCEPDNRRLLPSAVADSDTLCQSCGDYIGSHDQRISVSVGGGVKFHEIAYEISFHEISIIISDFMTGI